MRLPRDLSWPRRSTMVLLVLFIGVFTLYLWVRPGPAGDSRQPPGPAHNIHVSTGQLQPTILIGVREPLESSDTIHPDADNRSTAHDLATKYPHAIPQHHELDGPDSTKDNEPTPRDDRTNKSYPALSESTQAHPEATCPAPNRKSRQASKSTVGPQLAATSDPSNGDNLDNHACACAVVPD